MEVLRGRVARKSAAIEERMERALERVFDPGVRLAHGTDSFRPAIDLFETEKATVLRVELAGVRGEDLRLTLDGEYLQLSGRREVRPGEAPTAHLQMEIPQGQFERVIRIPSAYDADHVVAKLDDGLLVVELPRSRPRSKKIPVEGRGQ